MIRPIHLQNDRPHYFGRNKPRFYKTCIKIIHDHPHIIGKNAKAAYIEIINTIATPIHLRLKTAYKYGLINCKPCFPNTHNKFSTPKEKEITYRILFNFIPIRPTLKHCPFCKKQTIRRITLCHKMQRPKHDKNLSSRHYRRTNRKRNKHPQIHHA